VDKLLSKITYDATTGDLSFPAIPGFTLDTVLVHRTAAHLLAHAGGSKELAVRCAVWCQITAFEEAVALVAARPPTSPLFSGRRASPGAS